ncbi:uncharacterized protein LOC126284510 [Schistocerca gregaria]|uniref:uncharacterized protein LOC126284510 n=1 Tax=Schistocerca gregaria TaxID=7010 RepID=UPI00211E38AE|nr:uncharacterized protein LOC126284510 [Schistocerca gregaria]
MSPCLLLVLLCAATVMTVSGLKCYKCTIRPPSQYSNETERLCSGFDGSEKYQVDCPHSTFCMKKIFELSLQKGRTVHVELKDCASQRYIYQTLLEDQWVTQDVVIDAAYEEGCHDAESEGLRTAATTYCYCRGNLCNSAKPTHEPSHHHTDAMAVIFVFNAMKYIRSLR